MFARRTRRPALIAAIGALLFFFFPTTSYAHDHLVASSPEAGAVLSEAPAEITLVYSAELTQAGATVLITDEEGMDWANSEPLITADTVTVAVQEHIVSGSYVVQWRVVSSDGHPITGEVPFTLELPEISPEPEPQPTVATEPLPAPEPTVSPEPTAQPEPEPIAEPAPTETAAPAHPANSPPTRSNNSAVIWVVIGGSVLVAVWLTRRRISAGPGFQD